MTSRGSLGAALLATLSHPRWWLLALAGFLVRGGVIVVLLPIVAPPTVAGLMSFLAPTVVGEAITGGSSAPVAVVALGTAVVVTAFLWVAGWLGTWFDAELALEASADEDLASPAARPASIPAGLGMARLGPHLLTGVAFVFAATRIAAIAYREATSPGVATTPFVVRVVQGAPEAVVVLGIAWLLAEAAGGLALRDLLLRGRETVRPARWSIVRGIRDLLTRRGIATLVLVDVGVIVVAAPGWLAAGHAWDQLRVLLDGGAEVRDLAIGLGLFVGVTFGGAVLLAVALAWRATAWTTIFGAGDRHAAPVHGVGGVTVGPE